MSSLERFLKPYQEVRRAEGWGAGEPLYYRNLPHVAEDNPERAIWRIREASFRSLLHALGAHRRVLDAGAGNGWLAFQLARRGHSVVAVDVNDDERDGLGALGNYPLPLPAYQANFEVLPFEQASFDCIIFNASLHYARELAPVMAEALRVVTREGMIVVVDSPLYHDAASGQAMLDDKRRTLQERFGLDMAGGSMGFLTFANFQELGQTLGMCWRWSEPRVGLRWNTRHLRARLRGQREPAHFGLMIGRRNLDGPATLNPHR